MEEKKTREIFRTVHTGVERSGPTVASCTLREIIICFENRAIARNLPAVQGEVLQRHALDVAGVGHHDDGVVVRQKVLLLKLA